MEEKIGLCPICGDLVYLLGETKDGRLVGSCHDAFWMKQWQFGWSGEEAYQYYRRFGNA